MKGIALALTVLLAGCLSARDQDPDTGAGQACSILWHPGQVKAVAAQAGNGSRRLEVDGLDAHEPLAAWWFTAPDKISVLHARRGDTGVVQLNVAPNVAVSLRAGSHGEWDKEARVPAAGGDVALTLSGSSLTATLGGTWSDLVSVGGPAGTVWQPHAFDFTGIGIERLQELTLRLTWSNGVEGGADFGIAVGPTPDAEFHYTNSQYQATPGPQSEVRSVRLDELQGFGWTNETLVQMGPSISTGAISRSLPYVLEVTAEFLPDPDLPRTCMDLGNVEATLL